MALSVLHKSSLTNHKDCGVWCSKKERWIFNGDCDACYRFKHEIETIEQDTDNQNWAKELAINRRKMFGNIITY